MIAFTIPGEPLAFARAGRHGKFSFTPRPQANFMAAVRTICAAEMQGTPPLEGPVALEVHANYLWPKSVSAKKRRDPENAWKTSRADADNIAKLCADSLNGIAWRDDAQIASLHVWKQYAETASLKVIIRPLGAVAGIQREAAA